MSTHADRMRDQEWSDRRDRLVQWRKDNIMSNDVKGGWTPGPWRVDGREIIGSDDIHVWGRVVPDVFGHGSISSRSFTSRVCVVEGTTELPGPLANARLIASAPELFEALVDLLACADEFALRAGWPDNKPRNKARAVIAKATGGMPTP